MPRMIDTEALEASLAVMVEHQTEVAKGNDPVAAMLARMQIACLPSITRWQVDEFNNHAADDNVVLNGLVRFYATTMAGAITNTTQDERSQFNLVNKLLQGIAEEVGAILAGSTDHKMASVTTIDAGRG